MTHAPRRLLAALATVMLACAALVADAAPARAAATTHTPVMGPSLMSATELASWYGRHKGSNSARIPSLHDNVTLLAQIFIDEGNKEGVRGDMAFVQSMLETGWLSFAHSQIPPSAYNYAGIYAFNGRTSLPNCKHGDSSPSRCMGSPQHGVRVQIQLLRSYADPRAKNASGRVDLRALGSRGRRTALGVLRRQQLPVRQADMGVGVELRVDDHPHVLRSAGGERQGRRVRAVRPRARRHAVRHRVLDRDDRRRGQRARARRSSTATCGASSSPRR